MDLSQPDGTGSVAITNVTIDQSGTTYTSKVRLRATVPFIAPSIGKRSTREELEERWKERLEYWATMERLSHHR